MITKILYFDSSEEVLPGDIGGKSLSFLLNYVHLLWQLSIVNTLKILMET